MAVERQMVRGIQYARRRCSDFLSPVHAAYIFLVASSSHRIPAGRYVPTVSSLVFHILRLLIKYLALKFGDIKAYRAIRPFFMGVVVGEYAMIGIWTILGMFTGVGYYALPG